MSDEQTCGNCQKPAAVVVEVRLRNVSRKRSWRQYFVEHYGAQPAPTLVYMCESCCGQLVDNGLQFRALKWPVKIAERVDPVYVRGVPRARRDDKK